MFNKNNQRFFLPLWRNGRILFFTNYTEPGAMRQTYIVAAATEAGKTEVKRTYLAGIGDEDFKKCQHIADNGQELQQFLDAVGHGNLEHFSNQLSKDNPFYTNESDRLIYICLYLDLLRKYIVDEEIVRSYERATITAPLNAEKSHGILKTLSVRLEAERAAALFDRDFAVFESKPASNLAISNFLRAGAMAKSESGNKIDAEKYMLMAVKMQDSEDKWRRLGEFAGANDDPEAAIKYYHTAHALKPLPPASALLMANQMIKAGKVEELQPFLDIFKDVFPNAADEVRKKAEAIRKASADS